jgi:2-dehydro-3-deoxyglucarate aldolase
MTDNPLRATLESGDVAVGARTLTYAAPVLSTYGDLGLDFAWLDLEHTGPSPLDAGDVESLVLAARAAGVAPLVRIPGHDPDVVRKTLDAGVRTLLVPRVETAAQVERVLRAARFTYDDGPGARGATASLSNGWGADVDPERADATTLVGVMIEHERALDRLDEILAVPELGFVFVGPSDLSISLGHPYETDHPEVREAVSTVREACLDAGVPVGGVFHGDAAAREAVEDGYQVLRIGDELGAARTVLGERMADVRSAAGRGN